MRGLPAILETLDVELATGHPTGTFNMRTIELLQHAGARIDGTYKDKATAQLINLAKEKNIKFLDLCIKLFIELGIDINIINAEGNCFILALLEHSTSYAKQIFKRYPIHIQPDNPYAQHLLNHFAEHGNTEIVATLIQLGIDTNLEDAEGKTPFIRALQQFHDRTINKRVAELLSGTATVCDLKLPLLHINGGNPHIELLVDHAAEHGDIETIDLMRKVGYQNIDNPIGPLFTATRHNQLALIEWLLQYTTPIAHSTALHFAIEYNAQAAMRKLLERGIKINNHSDALICYCFRMAHEGNTAKLEQLLNGGFDPEIRWGRFTIADIAEANGHHEAVAMLCRHGVPLSPFYRLLHDF